jgi:hypothetical protein
MTKMETQSSLLNFDDDLADELELGQDPDLYSKAVLWSTDWTVKTIIQQIEDCNIDLSPEFQRRDAWSSTNKNRYLESVALQIPIPQIVLAEKKDQRGSYIVLDGKQRLLTLAQFAADLPEDHPVNLASKTQKKIRLSGLKILTDLNGKSYSDLKQESNLKKWKISFENHSIRCSIIRAWPNDNYLYEVFIRLNTGSAKLSPQELRQAMKPGSFTEFITSFSGNSPAIQSILGIDAPDFRMRDADLFLRLIAFNTRREKYQGNLKAFLDETHDVFNKNWNDYENKIKETAVNIDKAIIFLVENMGTPNIVGRRWNGVSFENAINRAILDVQIDTAIKANYRQKINERRINLSELTKSICEKNRNFVEAISGTTKSIGAVETRFGEWNKELEKEFQKQEPL